MCEQDWAKHLSEKIKHKELAVTLRNRGKIPYTAEKGVFDDWRNRDICWWTNGFWGGMMWQLYHATQEPVYRETAEELEQALDENLLHSQGMDHDSGFKWLPTAVANYRLTGSPTAKGRHGTELVTEQHHTIFQLAAVFIRHGKQLPAQILDHESCHEVLGLVLLGEHQEDGGLIAGETLGVQRAVEADRLLQLRVQKGVQPGQHSGQH